MIPTPIRVCAKKLTAGANFIILSASACKAVFPRLRYRPITISAAQTSGLRSNRPNISMLYSS
ncbi:hypothetical protein FTUN_6043 [Frigoriglobus tundricola]|uniref:Uncharacterized protein n=1 Tax=Frigoriglobus tundricola TaxID=2774151 RepID=A0A6M5YYZ5_9BACT|nr:hypothetical protein FTUN_6043 [Frigoriglobus tundricola]